MTSVFKPVLPSARCLSLFVPMLQFISRGIFFLPPWPTLQHKTSTHTQRQNFIRSIILFVFNRLFLQYIKGGISNGRHYLLLPLFPFLLMFMFYTSNSFFFVLKYIYKYLIWYAIYYLYTYLCLFYIHIECSYFYGPEINTYIYFAWCFWYTVTEKKHTS